MAHESAAVEGKIRDAEVFEEFSRFLEHQRPIQIPLMSAARAPANPFPTPIKKPRTHSSEKQTLHAAAQVKHGAPGLRLEVLAL